VSHDSPQQRLQPSHHFAIDSPHDSCRKGDDPSKVAHGVLSDERCESTITHVLRKGAFLAKSTSSSSHATAQTRPITRTREIAPAIQGGKLVFVGADSKSKYDFGRVFFAERTVSEKDLFEKLRENGEATSDETTLAPLRLYIERLQPLGIDSIVVLRSGSVESVELEVVSATASDFPTRSTDQDGVNAPADG